MTAPHAHGDFETRSAVDLKKCGVHVYAESDTTAPWCFSWAIGFGPIETWTPSRPGNIQKLFDHIAAGGVFVAHNAAFEIAIWAGVMVPRYGWPPLPLRQVRCTMAMALTQALPPSLEGASSAVNLDVAKDAEGAALMKKLARPRKVHPDGTITWWDTPETLERLYRYCETDVEVERRLETKLLPLSDEEQALWVLDQEINARGIELDRPAIISAMDVVDLAKAALDERMAAATGGAIRTCGQVQAIKDWLAERDIDVDGLAKADVIEILGRTDLPDDVKVVVEIRQEAAKSSTAKLKAMCSSSNLDSRARGLHQFHGATTGRWAGRRIQTQNLPRTTMKQDAIDEVLDLLSGYVKPIVEPDAVEPDAVVGESFSRRYLLVLGGALFRCFVEGCI